MPDNRTDNPEMDGLPAEFAGLHDRLVEYSRQWQETLPSPEKAMRFAHTLAQSATKSTQAASNRSQVHEKGKFPMRQNPMTIAAVNNRPRLVSSVLATVAVVALLSVVFAQLRSGTRSQPPSATQPPAAATCAKPRASLPPGVTLNAIALTAPADGWAVGSEPSSDGFATGLLMQFAQCRWQVAGPTFPDSALTSLDMLSTTDGWAVGNSLDIPGAHQPLLLHESGGTWQRVTLPAGIATNYGLVKIVMHSDTEGWIAMSSTKDAHGITHASLLHASQGIWSVVTPPLGYIADLSSAAPDDLWIVGSRQYNDGSTILAHYANGQWSQQPGPSPLEAAQLHMNSLSAGVVVFALYGANNLDQNTNNVAWSFNGSTWSPLALGGDRTGQDLHLLSQSEGWAFSKSYQAGIDSYATPLSSASFDMDGQWHTVAWAPTDVIAVTSLSRATANEYWAVGLRQNANTSGQRNGGGITFSSVFLHYVNGAWSEIGS